jgi:hypothetical protein
MAGMTNRGKYTLFNYYFRRQGTLPTNFYVALCTAAVAPGPGTNVLGDLTQIAVGNGYVNGGYQLTPNTTDFDVLNENDANDRAEMQLKNIVWNASGGPIPASGNGARYAVLTDDNGTVASRIVHDYWDFGSDRVVSDGQPLTLQDCEIRLTE